MVMLIYWIDNGDSVVMLIYFFGFFLKTFLVLVMLIYWIDNGVSVVMLIFD